MKQKFTKLLLFASAGAIFSTGQIAIAADAQLFKANNEPELSQKSNTEIKPAGPQLERATELIGAKVCNEHDERIGDVKDLMIDLQSGQAPFVVFSVGSFFGVGGRLCAAPITAFAQKPAKDEIVLSMDIERLKSAPGFDKNNWPDMDDRAWSSQVYSFYGNEEPYWESFNQASATSTVMDEPAGAELSPRTHPIEVYIIYDGLNPDRQPRQGLGAEDLTLNEQRINRAERYVASRVFIHEPAGAERTQKNSVAAAIDRERTSNVTTQPGKIKRASELIGLEVKNAQNENIGEIKDVVIDLDSGRVAYAVIAAGGFFGVGDKLYAVPPTVFTRSADEKWLVFNTDKETLKNAPGFEKNNWPAGTDQRFTKEVYRFYHQEPYWQSSGEIREPSGAERKLKLHRDDSSREIQEPSGAAPPLNPTPGAEINEQPAQAEPERSQSQPVGSPRAQEEQSQSSAAKETAEVEASNKEKDIREPAGATTESTANATAEDQFAKDSDRDLSKQVRTALETDTVLSTTAQNVKVSVSNGKIVLRGTVSNEQEKQAIAAKAQQIAGGAEKVENHLQVKSEPVNP